MLFLQKNIRLLKFPKFREILEHFRETWRPCSISGNSRKFRETWQVTRLKVDFLNYYSVGSTWKCAAETPGREACWSAKCFTAAAIDVRSLRKFTKMSMLLIMRKRCAWNSGLSMSSTLTRVNSCFASG